MSADLTSVAHVKQWLNIAAGVSADDALLARAVTAFSNHVQSWLNRTFGVATYSEKRNGTGTAMMAFKNYPVTAVSSLAIGATTIPFSSDGVAAGYVFDERALYLIGYSFPMGAQNVTINYTAGYAATDTAAIPATPFQITTSQPWYNDVGVTINGMAATRVTGTPTAGQYTVTAGVYTFASADNVSGKTAVINYGYTPPEIEQVAIELIAMRYKERQRIGENSKSIGGEVISFNVKDFSDSAKGMLNNYKRVIAVY